MSRVRPRAVTGLAIALAAVSGTVTAAGAAGTGGIRADIRADVNRDGAVDVTGGSDVVAKTTWNSERGAIFLPNLGDRQRRCKTRTPDGRWLSNARLQACNDAQGDVVRAPEYLAPLRTVPVGNVSDAATGSLQLVGSGSRTKVRLFLKRGDAWTYVTGNTRVTAAELRAGLQLGLDGRDVIREDWDGRITVRFTVTDGDRTSTDEVMLRAAPVLTQHHLQRAEQALVVDGSRQDPDQRRFAEQFAKEVRKAGITKPTYKFKDGSDIWAQDFVEPGYVSMPGPGGTPRVLRMMIRSAQMDRDAGRQAFELRGPGVGVAQINTGTYDQINSTGNLETIPPYTHRGRSYPAGRIITGRHGSRLPAHTAFLKAQQAQDPLVLETGWLGVGHVDEFVQFLPAGTPRGWKIGIADPEGGLALLRKAQRDGHGRTKMFSIPRSYAGGRIPTIDQALSDRQLLKDNAYAARKIKGNLALLKRETGVTDAEIVKIPAMYVSLDFPGQGGPSDGAPFLAAYYPGAINGVVLAPDKYLAPKQWGPVVAGKDILAEAVTKAYAKVGMRVRYLDDWRTHHVGGGEVHCGTNTIRAVGTAWWSSPK